MVGSDVSLVLRDIRVLTTGSLGLVAVTSVTVYNAKCLSSHRSTIIINHDHHNHGTLIRFSIGRIIKDFITNSLISI